MRQHPPAYEVRTPRLPASNVDPSRFECSSTIWRPHMTAASLFEVEIVIPRCCEPIDSLEWLQTLLQKNKQFKVTIYYRCPFCLPQSKANEWLQLINMDHMLQSKVVHAGGGVIIDDVDGGSSGTFSSRIRQLPLFDTLSNGKEFVSYIFHITSTFNSLADFTVFLHTTPCDHIKSSAIFERSIKYLAKCQPDGSVNSAFWFVLVELPWLY
jgi:hypothetical protein